MGKGGIVRPAKEVPLHGAGGREIQRRLIFLINDFVRAVFTVLQGHYPGCRVSPYGDRKQHLSSKMYPGVPVYQDVIQDGFQP